MGLQRRLRPLSAVSISDLPCACEGCVFWESAEPLEVRCGAACDPERAREWHSTVLREWGECGRVVMENDETLGFIKYAPPEYLPQAVHFPGAVPDGRNVLIACLHIRDDARRHGLGTLLLRAALRDLSMRGERSVFVYAGETTADMTEAPVIGVEFLIRNGFTVASPHPSYPLLRLDLKSLAMLTENLESVLDSLRIPLRRPARVPTPTVESRGARE